MKAYSFPRGGISYEDPAAPAPAESRTAFLPGLSVIPLMQYSGVNVMPLVAVGDFVREGMLVGRRQGPGQANVHATVPGKVVKTISWKTSGGRANEALVIRLEGAFEKLGKREKPFPWRNMSPHDIRRCIAEYGLVEMEGAGRPLEDIFAAVQGGNDLTLVIRCVFDDPWLAADRVLCRERLKAIVEGGAIAARAVKASRLLFAVSRQEAALGEAFLLEAREWSLPATVALTGSRYPQRNRRELELALRDYEKKEGLSLGDFFILGPASLAAVHDAVKFQKPVLDRYVAVGGGAVKSPQVLKVRIGSRIGDIFEECGGLTGKPLKIAAGSPLFGWSLAELYEPVVKTSYAVFALKENDSAGKQTREHRCIGCGECRRVCPVGLDPEDLYKRIGAGNRKGPSALRRAAECHGCGCCELVCPSALPLSSGIFNAAREKH